MDFLWLDVRYGIRSLLHGRIFFATSVLILALGIGANATIFSLLDAVIFHRMRVRNAPKLLLLEWSATNKPRYTGYSIFGGCPTDSASVRSSGCSFSLPMFNIFRSRASTLAKATAFTGPAKLRLASQGRTGMVVSQFVSGEFFQTLGVDAMLGRLLEPGDDNRKSDAVVVLNHSFWRTEFGSDRSVIGKTVNLNGIPVTIVGVTAPDFTGIIPGLEPASWVPLSLATYMKQESGMEDPASWELDIVALPRQSTSNAEVQADLSLLFRNEMLYGPRQMAQAADNPHIELLAAQKGLIGRGWMFFKPLYLLMAAVAFLLLVVCANIAGLMLVRNAGRVKETALRLALGASRMRVLRQFIIEAAIVTFLGTGFGIILALWGARSLALLVATSGPGKIRFDVHPDGLMLAFTASVGLLASVLCSLPSALNVRDTNLADPLKDSKTSLRPGHTRIHKWLSMRNVLVVVQVCISVLVLINAGLLVRTLVNLRSIEPGFDTNNILLFSLDPSRTGYSENQIPGLYAEVERRIRLLPGVTAVSHSFDPLLGGNITLKRFQIEGAGSDFHKLAALRVGAGFFSTMHIPLLAGREFMEGDVSPSTSPTQGTAPLLEANQALASQTPVTEANRPHVLEVNPAAAAGTPVPVLINEKLRAAYFGVANSDALGHSLVDGKAGAQRYVIIGVVGNSKYDSIRKVVEPTIYLPFQPDSAYFAVRSLVDPHAIFLSVRNAVTQVDGNLPLLDVKTESEQIDEAFFIERLLARFATVFGIFAVILVMLGIYGLLAYESVQRTREAAIRIALGARRHHIFNMIMGRGLWLTLAGACLGIVTALPATQYIRSLLYGIPPTDWVTLCGVILLIFLAAVAACVLPALWTTHIHPADALHQD